MSKGNDYENDLLLHIFQNAALALIGDAAGLPAAAAAGTLSASLHTGDPGEAGTPATSICTYTGYASVSVARSAAGWTVAANAASNAAILSFGACSAGPETASYFGISTLVGATLLLYSGAIATPSGGLSVTVGVTPSAAIGAFSVTED